MKTILAASALVTVALAAPQHLGVGVGHGAVGVAHPVGIAHPVAHGVGYNDLGEISPYNYQYGVADDVTGARFDQQESDDGTGAREGHYSVNLPDGRVQHVNYHADDITGYVSEVTYDGTAAFPTVAVGHGVVGHGVVGHGVVGHGVVGHGVVGAEVYPDEISPYTYQYNVADDYSGSNFQAGESDDGASNREGSYSVALPDGRIQHVNYHTNDVDGYIAEVTYEGTAAYPEVVAGVAGVGHGGLVGGAGAVLGGGVIG